MSRSFLIEVNEYVTQNKKKNGNQNGFKLKIYNLPRIGNEQT